MKKILTRVGQKFQLTLCNKKFIGHIKILVGNIIN